MNVVLWILQVLLAVAFFGAGGMHLVMPHGAMAAKMAWVADAPRWLPRFIGAMEVTGAIGLIAPLASRIAPWLTPLAACLLAVMMLIAAVVHVFRAELQSGVPSLVLFVLCASVALGRSNTARSPTEVERRSSAP